MKNYTTLAGVDYTDLISEITDYAIANPQQQEIGLPHKASFWIGKANELQAEIPSLSTTFSGIPLNVDGLAYKILSKKAATISSKVRVDMLLLPHIGCENVVINFTKAKAGAVLLPDPENYENYNLSDCDLVESVNLTTGILILNGTYINIEVPDNITNPSLGMVFFYTDMSSYFAE